MTALISRPPSAESRTVRGTVLDAHTGDPISGAVVHATGETATAHTGAGGGFVLPDVPAGALALVAGRPGYAFGWTPLDPPDHDDPAGTDEDRVAELRLARQDPADAAAPGAVPHPDYPRPDADRRAANDGMWLSLNGTWWFDFDPAEAGADKEWAAGDHVWPHAVAVPFSVASLAGIGEQFRASNTVYASQFADRRGTVWYHRELRVPADWPGTGGSLLRFGAVSWHTTVFLDGEQVGRHDGGYDPFDVDLGQLEPGSTHTLTVRVVLPETDEHTPYPVGKQTGWYMASGGIWQSVWLEPVAQARLTDVRVTPEVDFDGRTPRGASAVVEVRAPGQDGGAAAGPVRLEIREQKGPPGFAGPADADGVPTPREPVAADVVAEAVVLLDDGVGTVRIPIPEPRLWEPETPWLYRLRAILGPAEAPDDVLDTWFGLRTIHRDWAPGHSPAEQADPRSQYQYLYLNNRPIYLRSVLDQAFTPWGGYSYTGLCEGADLCTGEISAPRKGSILFDLALIRRLGANSVRMHIKVDDPRFYHWADVAGLLVWYDQPNFGYHGFGPRARELWESTLRSAVRRDHNHPSIVLWCAFNEAWGFGDQGAPIREDAIDWVREMTALTRDLTGGTRLVVDNSPCCENGHVGEDTDLNDFHGYHPSAEAWQRELDRVAEEAFPGSPHNFQRGEQSGQPLVNSEFGPWSGGLAHDSEVATAFRYTVASFRRNGKFAGYLFTELTDLEWEWNGWASYDRTLELPGYLDADGNPAGVDQVDADDVLVVGDRPVHRVAAGETVRLPVVASLFGDGPLTGLRLRWRIRGTDDLGAALPIDPWQQRPVRPEPFQAADLGVVGAVVPAGLVAGQLDAQLVRGTEIVAAGQTALVAADAPVGAADQEHDSADADTADDNMDAETVVPLDLVAAHHDWPQGVRVFAEHGAVAAAGQGDGAFHWRLAAPPALADADWARVQLVLEASAARPSLPRTAWPQSCERRFPTRLSATVNGVDTETVVLPDAPADARGVLSHEFGYAPGNFGFRVVLDVHPGRLRSTLDGGPITVTLRGAGGGLTVFGARTGRYGITPRLLFTADGGDGAPPREGLPGSDEAAPDGPRAHRNPGAVRPIEAHRGTPEGAGVSTHLVPGEPAPGRPGPMTLVMVNDSPRPIRDLLPTLVVPHGWKAVDDSGGSDDPPVDELAPGAAAYRRYLVTPGPAPWPALRTRLRYTDGEVGITESHWSLTPPDDPG